MAKKKRRTRVARAKRGATRKKAAAKRGRRSMVAAPRILSIKELSPAVLKALSSEGALGPTERLAWNGKILNLADEGETPEGFQAEEFGAAAGDEDAAVKKPFSEFFHDIAEGVVGAQRHLDDASLTYLRETANQPHVLPSVFRMPKLTAEMKFGITSSSNQGFNLVFWSNAAKAEKLQQQSVQFDIVALPPPPDAAKALFSMRFVLSPAERSDVLATLSGIAAPTAAANRALILELTERNYLVLLARGGVDHVLIAHVFPSDPDQKGARKLTAAVISDAPKQAAAQLGGLLAELGTQQEKALSDS